MDRIQHDLIQGSDEWHSFRLTHDGASEAAAMLGLTKKTTRTELLRAKHSGLPKVFSAYVEEKIFAGGHEAEALARPIVEEIIGESLYPQTYSYGRLSASCDGLTSSDQIAFEHKAWNKDLSASVAAGILPDEYMPQCQQIMHVTGAEKLIFVVSDGTRENMVYLWVTPDPEWVRKIEAGWELFHSDLASYQHVEPAAQAVAATVPELPTLYIQARGEITATNMPEFKQQVAEYVAGLNMKPATDQEFADSKAIAKMMREGAAKVKERKADMLAQTATMGTVAAECDHIIKLLNENALALEKAVTAEEEARKLRLIERGRSEVSAHIAALNKRLGRVLMPAIPADFAAAIKSKRNLDSMENGINTEVARVKLAANEIADKIDINLKALAEAKEHAFLFNDAATIVMKASDDLALIIKTRIDEHVRAEEKRLSDEREKIRIEEEAKAAAKVKAEQESQRLAEASRKAADEAKAKAEAEEAERQRKAGEEAAAKIERDRLSAEQNTRSDAQAGLTLTGAQEPAAPAAPGASSPRLDETPKAAAPIRTAIVRPVSVLRQIHDALDECTDAELNEVANFIMQLAAKRFGAAA